MSALFHRLWFRLMGAFSLVILAGILVTVLLARQNAATQITHVRVGSHMVDPAVLQTAFADYYGRSGSWTGVDREMDRLVTRGVRRRAGMMGGAAGMSEGHIQLTDANGLVVADSQGSPGGTLPTSLLNRSWPVQVEGRTVGYLVVDGSFLQGSSESRALLDNITGSVLGAGLIAGLLALVLAGLLVRQITRPLGNLARASRRISQGDLAGRVEVPGQGELGEVAVAFNQMVESLQQQERLRRNLMADIAHELRTPLTGIQGTVEALQDGVFRLTQENLTPIHEQVLLLQRLVEDLRTLAHAEAGQLSLSPEALSVEPLVRRVTTLFSSQALAQEVAIQVTAPADLPQVMADPLRLEQILSNLIANGLRYSPQGGRLTVELTGVAGGVRIAVVDQGSGIAAQDLPHLFRRFYRADPSRSRQTGGSGLGLAIARQLVEAQGGRIWAESPPQERSQGSGFFLELPASPER